MRPSIICGLLILGSGQFNSIVIAQALSLGFVSVIRRFAGTHSPLSGKKSFILRLHTDLMHAGEWIDFCW